MARVPIERTATRDQTALETLQQDLEGVVYGQDEAVRTVVRAVKRSRAGLGGADKPTGSFLFTGPTGVGKTELAKQLAEQLGVPFLRFDMSEYMEKHAVSRLIGAPPGYVGYEEGGALTEAVRRRPYQIVLFDEVEKAHPDVFNVMLQVLDDGRLTDGQGRTVDFRNTLIVMTSNLGSEALANQPAGQDSAAVRDLVMEAVRAAFRPEFLNRLDEILLFHRLTLDQMTGIVEIQLARLRDMLAERKIALDLDDNVTLAVNRIPRSPNYPVIFLGDDAEIVGDGVAPLVCVFWDSIPEKTEHSIDKLGEGRIVAVVGNVFMHDAP